MGLECVSAIVSGFDSEVLGFPHKWDKNTFRGYTG